MPHIQSILHPAGIRPRAQRLWWVMFWICTAVWFAVAIALSRPFARPAPPRGRRQRPGSSARRSRPRSASASSR
jgi:hypothetical protein